MTKLENKMNKVVAEADAKIIQEFNKMYEDMIDQYYTYRTKYYYRHDAGKGTGIGLNLYRARDMRIEYGTMLDDYFIFGLAESEMEGYKHTSIEQVLENVMKGWRRVSEDYTYAPLTGISKKKDKNGNVYCTERFEASVNFLGHILTGTPIEILLEIIQSNIVKKYRLEYFLKNFKA